MSAWQPIETAPRDGTRILGWHEEGHEIVEWTEGWPDFPDQPGNDAGWIGVYAYPGRSSEDRCYLSPQGQPTHWQPLPEPPQEEG